MHNNEHFTRDSAPSSQTVDTPIPGEQGEKSNFQYTDPIVSEIPNVTQTSRLSTKVSLLEEQREEEISEPFKQKILEVLETRVKENISGFSETMDNLIENQKEEDILNIKESNNLLESVSIPSYENILKYLNNRESLLSYEGLFSIYSQINLGVMTPKRLAEIVSKLSKLEISSHMHLEEDYVNLSEKYQNMGYKSPYSSLLNLVRNAKSKQEKWEVLSRITRPIIESKANIKKQNTKLLRSAKELFERNLGYLQNPDTLPGVMDLKADKEESLSRMKENLEEFISLISLHQGRLTTGQIMEYSDQVYGEFRNPIKDEIYHIYTDILDNHPSKLQTLIDHEKGNLANLWAGSAETQEARQKQLDRLNRQRQERGLEPLEKNPYIN